MPNILHVTTPELRTDYGKPIDSHQDGKQAENLKIQNPIDPSRVVRADRHDDGQSAAGDNGSSGIIDYESNYSAFIRQLAKGAGVAEFLESYLLHHSAATSGAGSVELDALVKQLMQNVSVDTPEGLLSLFKEHTAEQTLFSGGLFDRLRELLRENPSENAQRLIGAFLKNYSAGVSGKHFLNQIKNLSEDIPLLMQRRSGEEFKQLAGGMDWNAANGDVSHNAQILNRQMIPFLASYISKSHDYGAIREAAMLLIYNAVRYESGGTDQIQAAFDKLLMAGMFRHLDGEEELQELLKQLDESRGARAEGMAKFLEKGVRGEAGTENVQAFRQAVNSALLNESVYMPLLHFALPFMFQGLQGLAEGWIDPDEENENGEGERHRSKIFLKFHIEGLGKFELLMSCRGLETDIDLKIPAALNGKENEIGTAVAAILEKNNINGKTLAIGPCRRDTAVEEVFPVLLQKGSGMNVRV